MLANDSFSVGAGFQRRYFCGAMRGGLVLP